MTFDKFDGSIIVRENTTFICIGSRARTHYDDRRNLKFEIYEGTKELMSGSIFGSNDTAIAETATFFWSLKHPGENSRLKIKKKLDDEDFDFGAFQSERIARFLDASPTRALEIQARNWSREQSIVLATQPYPFKLKLPKHLCFGEGFGFDDDGSAFVDALEGRQSSFGSLVVDTRRKSFSTANLRRLLKLEIFESLPVI